MNCGFSSIYHNEQLQEKHGSKLRQDAILLFYAVFRSAENLCFLGSLRPIGHFTVVCSVAWPMNGCEAAGDLVLIQTSLLLSCKLCFCYCN